MGNAAAPNRQAPARSIGTISANGEDADFGSRAAPRTPVPLHSFKFPFSGSTWDTLTIDTPGSIGFGLHTAATVSTLLTTS
jgi:hypothetical protein